MGKRIFLEKVRDDSGRLLDLIPVTAGTIVPAHIDGIRAGWAQIIAGKVVAHFVDGDLLVLEP